MKTTTVVSEDSSSGAGSWQVRGFPRVWSPSCPGVGYWVFTACVCSCLCALVIYQMVQSQQLKARLENTEELLGQLMVRLEGLEKLEREVRGQGRVQQRHERQAGKRNRRSRNVVSKAYVMKMLNRTTRTTMKHVKKMIDLYTNVPSAHLTLHSTNGEDNRLYSGQPYQGEPLRWISLPNSTVTHNMFGDSVYDWKYQEIRVLVPGLYNVYAQITFNGRNPGYDSPVTEPYPCSFEVVRTPVNQPTRNRRDNEEYSMTLLFGSSTQVELGKKLRVSEDGDDIFPYDSIHTSGVFRFEANDRLRVQGGMFSNDCTIMGHEDKTFFGLFLVMRDNVK